MSISSKQAKRIKEARKTVSKKKEDFLLKPVEPSRRQEVRFRNLMNGAIDSTRDAVMQLYNSFDNPQSIEESLDATFANMQWWDELNLQVGANIDTMDDLHREAFYETITSSIGVNVAGFVNETGLGDLLNSIIDDNVNKVEDLKGASKKRVADLIRNAITGQEDKSLSLEKQIRNTFKTTKNQAKFIARDQTQRNVNTLNRFRQEHAGIDKYKWVTSKDNRVRDDHAKMDGLEVDWKTGKILKTILSVKRKLSGKNVKNVANGHVGQDYQCRCVAVPILEV